MDQTPSSLFIFPEVRVVEASAGSGKTYALAKRYVQLLLNPSLPHQDNPLRDILAITFTNKAAVEMKGRILDFLKRLALGQFPPEQEKDLLVPIGLSPLAARQSAARAMDMLIQHYNFFQVQTIDSFIKSLLSGCAFKLGMSAGFKIKRNARDYLGASLDGLIDQAGRDTATRQIFLKFLEQYLFLENKPGWFPKKDILELLVALFREGNTFGEDFSAFHWPGEDLATQKQDILKSLRALAESLPDGTDGRFRNSLEKFLGEYRFGFDTDRVPDWFAREEFPARKNTEVSGELVGEWSRIRRDLQNLCEAEAYSLFNPYLEIFAAASGIFTQKVQEDDVVFLESLNRQAQELFAAGTVSVGELYYRMATRVQHYLLDEFQDTSVLQWRNLSFVIEEALSGGGSLFYVGDRKQAIYSFRGGEARLFDEVQKVFSRYNVCHEQLANNYRSQRAIVEFNNQVFSVENLRRFVLAKAEVEEKSRKGDLVYIGAEDLGEIAGVFAHSRQTGLAANDGGYVRVERVDADNKEERDEIIEERVLSLLADLRQRYPLSAIAFLTRSNDEIEQLTSWLLSAGYPVQSERTSSIKEHPLVGDILALLRFLDSPIDNLAFVRFLSGEVFRQASGLTEEQVAEFLFSLRSSMTGEKTFYVYRAFREAFPALWEELFDEFFRNVGLYPLYELTASIVKRFGILAWFPGQQGFVMRFLELIKSQEEEDSALSSFLEKWEDLPADEFFVQMNQSQAIRILTVHKAKGLEFPVVILPFLAMRVQVGTSGGLGQLSYVMDASSGKLRLLRIKDKYLKFSETLASVWKWEYQKAFLAELNNVYVALTRAAAEMYIFIPKKVATSFNLANLLVPGDVQEIGQVEKAKSAPEARVSARVVLPAAAPQDWLSFLRREFREEGAVSNRSARQKGEILHAVLAGIGNTLGQDVPTLLSAALKQAQATFPEVSRSGEYTAVVTRILNAPQLQMFFAVADGEVWQEQELVTSAGHSRRVDRLIVKEQEVWVVDYKSSREGHVAYAQQLEGYRELVASLYPGRTVRAFLLYLDEMDFEEVVDG